ncbi:hypothetical protein BDR06DRAFT_852502, partial [Suillus hirtellus]
CHGVTIYWPVREPSFVETFPVGRASDGPGTLPFDIDTRGAISCAYSKYCERNATPGSLCTECVGIVSFLEHLVLVTQDIKLCTHYRYRNHFDMVQVVRRCAEDVNCLKLQHERVTHVLTRLDDYQSLIIALSENDIPRIKHIL